MLHTCTVLYVRVCYVYCTVVLCHHTHLLSPWYTSIPFHLTSHIFFFFSLIFEKILFFLCCKVGVVVSTCSLIRLSFMLKNSTGCTQTNVKIMVAYERSVVHVCKFIFQNVHRDVHSRTTQLELFRGDARVLVLRSPSPYLPQKSACGRKKRRRASPQFNSPSMVVMYARMRKVKQDLQ